MYVRDSASKKMYVSMSSTGRRKNLMYCNIVSVILRASKIR